MKNKLTGAAKALVPAALTLLGVLAYSLQNGSFDRVAVVGAGVGLIGSAITYFVPNAGPEVQAAEALFSPVAAGHPDPEPAAAVPAAPAAPAAAPVAPPAPAPEPAPPAPPTPPAAA